MQAAPVNVKQVGRDKRRRNALTHGLRSVSLGMVPKGASYVGKLASKLRRDLEAAVVDAKGEVSLLDACHVNAAVKWERHGLLAQRWLAKESANMSLDQRLNFSREVAKAAENRNRSIAALKLDEDAGTILESLYASPRPTIHDGDTE